jgi:hypothetical protein
MIRVDACWRSEVPLATACCFLADPIDRNLSGPADQTEVAVAARDFENRVGSPAERATQRRISPGRYRLS